VCEEKMGERTPEVHINQEKHDSDQVTQVKNGKGGNSKFANIHTSNSVQKRPLSKENGVFSSMEKCNLF